MQYFVLLTAATAMIAVLAAMLYRRSQDPGVWVSVGALYYWSLYGAWFIVIDKSGGMSGKRYQYLESKLFPLQLDQNYLLALGLYASFILMAELTALALLKRRDHLRPCGERPLGLRHEPVIAVSALAGLASWLIIRSKLQDAWALNASAYLYTRMQTDQWFTWHQVLNRVALIPPSIGIALIASGRNARAFLSLHRGYTLWAYLAILGAMGCFTFVLGNKNEVLVSLVTGILTYWGTARRPKVIKVVLVAAAGAWFLYCIDFFRGVPLANLRDVVTERIDESTAVGTFVTSSNEAYGAHFSMYGVLEGQVPPKFGYSLYALVCSVIPRVIWPDRPLDIYYYYAESVGATEGQGYSLHHATGWYLNFGSAGVVLGGVVFGLVWAFCLNAKYNARPRSGLAYALFARIAPWLFAANVAPLLRAGPEAYKGWLLETVLIPVGVLLLGCRAHRRAQDWIGLGARGWSRLGPDSGNRGPSDG